MNKKFKDLIKHDDYSVLIENIKIFIMDGVFSPDPDLTYSSMQMIQYLKKLDLKDKEILDIGCGTGLLGIYALKNKANHVIFSDMSKIALKNTQINLDLNNIPKNKYKIIESNIFSDIHEKFDIIIANLPIANYVFSEFVNDNTENIAIRFIEKCVDYLKKDGYALLNWGSIDNNFPIEEYLIKNNFKFKHIIEEKFRELWYVFEIKP